ncbi:MFS transporter [Actinoallomurus acaciae]|uniref:MFS transporter n=1 Tax=Actinoallomurus acaciae TaxID=502577 RepID=A0ABV5YJP2_9ACTN
MRRPDRPAKIAAQCRAGPEGASINSSRNLVASAFVAFAAFGSFWGVWGASVPRVQRQADVSDGRLGLALLFVGAGALPAMLLAGRALDRWGVKIAAGAIGLLGVVGAGLALTAVNLPSLCVGLGVAGASSGAADVTMNAVAGRAEKNAGRPVITRVHGVFSTFVVLTSLGAGLASAASWPLAVPFIAVAVLCLVAGAAMLAAISRSAVATTDDEEAAVDGTPSSARIRLAPLLLVGVLGTLAFASENAHQSWSAVFAQNELHAGASLTTVAPAVFAGTVAITRFSIGGLKTAHARSVILAGALAAAGGALVIAAAPTMVVAALGLVLAGAGTAVLFPTLLGIVSRNVEETYRGRATSIVSTVSYLGFLLGPVYVGAWADAAGLRGAMIAVAALAAALFVLTPLLLRLSGYAVTTVPPRTPERAVDHHA